MSNTSKSSSNIILACIDGSNVTQSVCDYAAWYAENLNLSVELLHVIGVPKSTRHDLSGSIGMDSRKFLLDELAQLDEQQSRIANKHGNALVKDAKQHILASKPDLEVHTHLRRGKLLPAIKHYADDSRVIVLGRRGTDHQNNEGSDSDSGISSGINIGSQIESVVRTMSRPIMVCSHDFVTPDSYMLAFDGSPTAKKAVDIICSSRISPAMTGHLVMVDDENSKHVSDLNKAQAQMKSAGLDVTNHIINPKAHGNDVVSALTVFQTENNISVFVLGAYGHSKFRQFFVGSTTTKLISKTTTPVLLLR